jgi:hypothetical protein
MPSAAAVTATVNSQGNLTIKGGGGDDQLHITPGMNPDEVTIMANSPINGGGMTATLGGVTGNIRVSVAAGDDEVAFEDFNGADVIGGKLTLALGPGNDLVDLLDTGALDNLKISLGPGDDDATVSSATFQGKLKVSGGKGIDGIVLDSLLVAGQVRLAGGNDGDDIFIGFCDFNDKVVVAAGAGDDGVTTDISNYNADSLFNGGKGAADDYQDAGGNTFDNNTIKNFEL